MSSEAKRHPKVHFMHPSLFYLLKEYRVIKDAIAGEPAVKSRRTEYLPNPSNESCNKLRSARYDPYLKRANFYNLTRRTLNGLLGQVFMKEPKVEAPGLEAILEDASGEGVSLNQQSKKTLSMVLSMSRAGLFVDHPAADSPITRKQKEEGFHRPTIYTYEAQEIVNWRVVERGNREGARDILSLVVLYETYEYGEDFFEKKTAEQYRVLGLDSDGYYYQQLWRELKPRENMTTSPFDIRRENQQHIILEPKWVKVEEFFPTDASGKRFQEIPFTFIGSLNNDPHPDPPNFFDLASLNIAHYRNSADYEEALFQCGQPTIAIAGLTKEWVDDQLDGKVLIGAQGGIQLPVGGTAKMLQPLSDMPGLAAMEHKERQMVALGAKLIEQNKVEKTAYEVKLEATADGSVLSTTANNVSRAFTLALEWCNRFMGNSGKPTFELNTKFDLVRMSPEEQREIIESWIKGGLSFKEMRDVLRNGGIATDDDDVVLKEAEEKRQKDIEMQREQFAAQNNNAEGQKDNEKETE